MNRLVIVALVLLAGCSLALTAGCSSDPTGETVKGIIDDLASQRFGTATARYRADEELILGPAAAPAWRRGLEHQDPTVREWSIDSIARIGLPEDVDRVIAALDDPFRNVQEAAARSLVELDPEAARGAFIAGLSATDPMKQTIAAQGLADLGDAAGVEPLIDRLDDDRVDDAVRGVIAQSLALLADPRAVAPLAAVAANPVTEVRLRRNAAEALATFENEEATEALRGLLDSEDDYVREVARRSIGARR
jgi:HEAT repeat protein